MHAAIGRALDKHREESLAQLGSLDIKATVSQQGEQQQQQVWPGAALDHLLFALRSDPSVRFRREATKLLAGMEVLAGSAQVCSGTLTAW